MAGFPLLVLIVALLGLISTWNAVVFAGARVMYSLASAGALPSTRMSALGTLASVVGTNQGNINNLKITNRTPQFFDMQLDIEVRDAQHLNDIMAALRSLPAVNSVQREMR